MEVLDATATRVGEGVWRLVILVAEEGAVTAGGTGTAEPVKLHVDVLGEGPTGHAVPDRIVRYLIEHAAGPDGASTTSVRTAVGGNSGTVNRQVWTLATNAPDLQKRLRGWVQKVDRGRYALTLAARRRLAEAGHDQLQAWHLSEAAERSNLR